MFKYIILYVSHLPLGTSAQGKVRAAGPLMGPQDGPSQATKPIKPTGLTGSDHPMDFRMIIAGL